MPGTYWIDKKTNIVVKRYSGTVTVRCVLNVLDSVEADPEFASGMNELNDSRAVTAYAIARDELEHLAELVKGYNVRVRGLSRKAVVVLTDETWRTAHLYRSLVTAGTRLEVGVFDAMSEALDFLRVMDEEDRQRLMKHQVIYN